MLARREHLQTGCVAGLVIETADVGSSAERARVEARPHVCELILRGAYSAHFEVCVLSEAVHLGDLVSEIVHADEQWVRAADLWVRHLSGCWNGKEFIQRN